MRQLKIAADLIKAENSVIKSVFLIFLRGTGNSTGRETGARLRVLVKKKLKFADECGALRELRICNGFNFFT